ncbi:hypothetical protein C1H46_011131 [Malus baccata]|uniref:Uncharacterized protein n=1 Tax=Malus baccata TaxID=106549 RepID=A0A540MY08_MALBA|nr:hypothetical protein C1H46_011131 [Malus baccata]
MWGHLPKPLQHIKTLRHSSKCPWISFFSYSYSDAPHKRSKLAPPQGVVVAVVAPALAAVDMISVADLMVAQLPIGTVIHLLKGDTPCVA